MHHQHTVVEPYLTLAETRLAETGARKHAVNGFPIGNQSRLNGIQVTISPRPEMEAVDLLLCADHSCFARLHGDRFTMKARHLLSVDVEQLHAEGEGTRP